MKKTFTLYIFVLTFLLVACGKNATPVATDIPAATSTPDLCSKENLSNEAAKANKLMREFDDYSALASNTPQSQLVVIIPQMQSVRRETEDLVVPPCLQTLKNLELAHMNLVIQTLMAFMNNSDVKVINAGIAQARELHNQYSIELARLLGVTLVPQPTSPATTPQADQPSATSVLALVTNPGPNGVNLRGAPDLSSPEAGALGISASTAALGRSADDQWIQVEIPDKTGETAWVYASLVQLSVPIEQLPVVNP